MTLSAFFGKFKSKLLWGNLAAMAVVVLLLALGVKYGLDLYTHHGERIRIPRLIHMKEADAKHILQEMDLLMVVTDTGYVKTLPANVILEQNPDAGEEVKAGRTVYVTINAANSPTITLPDVIDNSSLREAMAKLTAMGFRLGPPQFVDGEKDWVYGILVDGRHVVYGDKIPIDATLIIQAGNGLRSMSDSVNYVDPVFEEEDDFEESPEVDDFEEVAEPPAEPAEPPTETPESPTAN